MDVEYPHDGDLTITDHTTLEGVVRGMVRVQGGHCTVTELGMVSGDVVVEFGSALILGSVGGDVLNIDGAVSVVGVVRGTVRGNDSTTQVDRGAEVEHSRMSTDSRDAVPPAVTFVPTTEADLTVPSFAGPGSRLRDARRRRAAQRWRPGFNPRFAAVVGGGLVAAVTLASVAYFVLGEGTQDTGSPATVTETSATTSPETTAEPTPPPTTLHPIVQAIDDEAARFAAQRLVMLEVIDDPSAGGPLDPADYSAVAPADDCRTVADARREETSIVPVTKTLDGCQVLTGQWLDQWTGEELDDVAGTVVDHILPLEIAHDSGAWRFTEAEKQAFASDSAVGVLHVVSPATQQDRGASLPDSWQPSSENYCYYAAAWIHAKARWSLSVTEREVGALTLLLARCDDADAPPLPDGLGRDS